VIIIDTNVISEVLRPSPSDVVLRWLSAQQDTAVFTTTVTLAELLYGIEALPQGKRRDRLGSALERVFAEGLQHRVLAFDEDAAHAFPSIVITRQRSGRPIVPLDAMIASIAKSRGCAVATRNIRDFENCGVRVVNPWAE
jgi:predicted nucleic acid-binding protein